MEKATLTLFGENHQQTKIPVLFNPSEYNISRSVNYAKLNIPGTDNPIMQFINGGDTSLKLTLHFDTQNDFVPKGSSLDVRTYTDPILKSVAIDGKLHAPPIVAFSWGSFYFKGNVVSAEQHFTMFLPSGLPVRARLELSIVSVAREQDGRRRSPFESPDRTKTRYAEQGSALWQMAEAEYGDASYWRVIADFNGIHNPRRFPTGKLLQLPPLREI